MPHLVHCTERKGATCYKCPFKARNTTHHLLSLKVLQNSGPESITNKRTEPQRWRLNYIFWECSCALPLSPATNISTHSVCVCQTGGRLQGNRGEREMPIMERHQRQRRSTLEEAERNKYFGVQDSPLRWNIQGHYSQGHHD